MAGPETQWAAGMRVTADRLRKNGVQSGGVTVSFTARAAWTVNITFPVPFTSPPVMSANIASGAGSTARWGARAINITPEGFPALSVRGYQWRDCHMGQHRSQLDCAWCVMPAWRRSPLPANWAALRVAVFRRDGWVCQLQGPRCAGRATEVDHVEGHSDHRLSNLRSACKPCHATRTGQQGAAARSRPSRLRPAEAHPSLRSR